MKNIKFYNFKTKLTAFALITTMSFSAIGLTSCTKKKEQNEEITSSYALEEDMMNTTVSNLKSLFPNLSDEIIDNAAMILLLDELAKEDENGKISADALTNFKSKIDSNNMMNEYNAFLDVLENTITEENKVISISNSLPPQSNNDAQILSKIEKIVSNMTEGSTKEEIVSNFNKIYSLFVENDEITEDGLTFNVRDLSYSARAVASTYARTAAYFARNYINEDKYSKIDKRTNDQNNKAYIKTKLEILSNELEETSEIDVINLFNNQSLALENIISGKVNASKEDLKNLVSYMNLKYLDSDKVATKDKNNIVGDYENSKINDTIILIDAISEYNKNNQSNMIAFSSILVNEYKSTEMGSIDKIALDFVQYNSIMLLNSVKEDASFEELFNNQYFQNLYKYFTKQDFTHKQKNNEGTIVENKINWQEISDGVNFVNNEVILYTLNKYSKVKNIEWYTTRSQVNLTESITYIQNTITGECQKVDSDEFVKVY